MSNLAGDQTTPQHSPALSIARWLFVAVALLLAACSQQPNATAPTSAAVAAVPSPAPASTSAPVVQPTAAVAATAPATQPTAAAQTITNGKALYACVEGLCSSSLSGAGARTVVPFSSKAIALDGYAFSSDGSKIVYGLRNLAGTPKDLKAANMYLANADGSESKPLFSIQGKADANNVVSGVGVLGLSADNTQVIFVERGQVFTSALDGANRKEIIKSIGIGQDGAPIVSLSPQGTSLLVVEPSSANNVTLYNVADGSQHSYNLDFSMRAETFGSDDKHIVAVRYDPPFDPKAVTQTAVERKILGYTEVNTDNGMSRSIGDTTSDWSASVISNAVGGHVVLADKANALALLDLSNGQHTPVTLPQYNSGARVVLFAITS